MFIKPMLITAALLSFSTAANAYTIIATQKQAGTVTAVDVENHQLTVADENNREQTVTLSPNADAIIGKSRAKAITRLEVGHSIVWQQKTLKESSEELSGKIKAVDYRSGTIDLKLDNSETVTIKLDPKASISSIENEALSFQELRRGFEITIKTSQKFSEIASAQAL